MDTGLHCDRAAESWIFWLATSHSRGGPVVKSIALTAAGVGLLVSLGVCHGVQTERWAKSTALHQAAARLANVPDELGAWRGEAVEIDTKHLKVAEAAGHVARTYVHKQTGERVSVLVLCGRPGPLAVHTPDVCYANAGYEAAGESARVEVAGGRLWTNVFRMGGSAALDRRGALRVYWGWSAGGPFAAPADPRVEYWREPALFKLYVVRPGAAGPAERDPAGELMGELLPALGAALAAP